MRSVFDVVYGGFGHYQYGAVPERKARVSGVVRLSDVSKDYRVLKPVNFPGNRLYIDSLAEIGMIHCDILQCLLKGIAGILSLYHSMTPMTLPEASAMPTDEILREE